MYETCMYEILMKDIIGMHTIVNACMHVCILIPEYVRTYITHTYATHIHTHTSSNKKLSLQEAGLKGQVLLVARQHASPMDQG